MQGISITGYNYCIGSLSNDASSIVMCSDGVLNKDIE
jgi:hypothetical protein